MTSGVSRIDRALFVTRSFPADLEKATYGIYTRMRLFLDALAAIADTIDILFYVNPEIALTSSDLSKLQDGIHTKWKINSAVTASRLAPLNGSGFWSSYLAPALTISCQKGYGELCHKHQLTAFEECLNRKPKLVFIHRLPCMLPPLLSTRPSPALFFDLDGIDHDALIRSIRQPPRWRSKFLHYLQVPALMRTERRAIRLARRTFVCSEKDRDYLVHSLGLERVSVVPNAVSIPLEQYSLPASPSFLFMGTYSYQPNVNAVEWMMKDIWPIIKKKLPNAKMIIAGNKPEMIPSFSRQPPGVEFTGFVQNVEELYRVARVVCCPLLEGTGTRVKIVEASSRGKAIVSTSIGAEGLQFLDGKEILIRNNAHDFADACIALAMNDDLCSDLGKSARAAAKRRFDRQQIIADVVKTLGCSHDR